MSRMFNALSMQFKKQVVATNRLPAEYQEVEYLESTSEQWIETDFFLHQDCKIELKATRISGRFIFGARSAVGTQSFLIDLVGASSGQISFYFDGATRVTGPIAADNTTYEIEASKKGFYIDGSLIGVPNKANKFTLTYPLVLFGGNELSSSIIKNRCRLFYERVYDNGTLSMDFIPCYRISDSKPGMYDTVNDVFYVNQGTGADFLVGPVKGGQISFNSGVKCYTPKATFYGKCLQDGTPTPESPVPVLYNNGKWELKDADGVTISTVDLSLLPDGGLYGIGDVQDEWDCVSGDGIRRFGKVDLGTLNWTYLDIPSWNCFVSIVSSKKIGQSNIVCEKYPRKYIFGTVEDNILDGNSNSTNIYIRDGSFNNDPVAFKSAMSGVMLYYELATPVPFHATPQPLIQANGFNTLTQISGDIADTDVSVEYVKHS